MMATVSNLPVLDSWVKEFIRNDDFLEIMVADPEDSIETYLQACSKVEVDGWVYADNDAFHKKLLSLKSIKEINNHFWEYHFHQIDVYQRLVMWRSEELIKGSTRLLNLKELNSAAVIARSILELAVKCYVELNFIKGELVELLKKDHNFSQEGVASTKIEELIQKIIFSDMNLWKDDDLYPTNIMNHINHIDKLYKKANHKKFIRKLYGDLCEICHPNALGYLRYIEDNQQTISHGYNKATANKKNTSGHWQKRIIKLTISSLSWSSEAFINSISDCNAVIKIFSEENLS